ncbi:unnamed protein product [Mytilus edulis]|uniref:Uncharacterized protein n=1 Tax=Mytilus edulis TaxID=6550 RepID=A0A8S3SY87_MYTED|nr:unnamed protein product [Mytilus edulis]
MLTTPNLFYCVQHFIVRSPVELSDHCLLSVCFKSCTQRETTLESLSDVGKFQWEHSMSDNYHDALLHKESVNDILDLMNNIDDENCDDIDFLVSSVNKIYVNAASQTLVLKKKSSRPSNKRKRAKPKKAWMSNDCLLLRKEVRSLGKRLQKDKNNANLRQTYSNCVKHYNKQKKSLKAEFYRTFISKLNSLEHKDSKSFWKSINNLKNNHQQAPSPLSKQEWKTQTMILSNSKNRSLLDKHYFYFGPQPLESATEYKYLGIVFNNRGKLNIAAENLADKARKAYFALKSKLPYSNCIAVEKWVRLFNSLISPIMTYGSEIWISDFNINLDTADKLPFEKVQNMIMKNILGVHGKASNLALRTELELYPVCFISYKLMFKYYARLTDIEVGNNPKFDLLKSAFIEDKKLYTQKSSCWVQSLHKLKKLINFDSLQISHNVFEDSLKNFYKCKILGQLEHIKSNNTDLREKFDIFKNLNNDDDIKSTIYLLNPVNLVDTRQICNYLSQAFELRNKNLMSVGLP